MKTKFLKYLLLGLVMVVSSCSDENNDENEVVENEYPKTYNIQVKTYSVDNENIKADIIFQLSKIMLNDVKDVSTKIEEEFELEEVSLPYEKKVVKTVDNDNEWYNINFSVQSMRYEKNIENPRAFVVEIIVNGKSVLKKNSTQTEIGNLGTLIVNYDTLSKE